MGGGTNPDARGLLEPGELAGSGGEVRDGLGNVLEDRFGERVGEDGLSRLLRCEASSASTSSASLHSRTRTTHPRVILEKEFRTENVKLSIAGPTSSGYSPFRL